MCGKWDKNRGNDQTEFRVSPKDSLFFYKPTGGKVCLNKDACNPEKKFKAQRGWTNLVFPGTNILNFFSYFTFSNYPRIDLLMGRLMLQKNQDF